MQCKNCGAEVGIEYRLCPYCRSEVDHAINSNGGSNQPIIIQNVIQNSNTNTNTNNNTNINSRGRNYHLVSRKNKWVTLILAIFFGYFGIHRFYVGKIGSGIAYAFTVGFFMFGWIYDIIKIASGTFTDGKGLVIK